MEKDCLKNHILNIQCKYVKLTEKWIDFVKLGKPCPDLECNLLLLDWGLDVLCRVYNSYEKEYVNIQNSVFSGVFALNHFPSGIPNIVLSGITISIKDNNMVEYILDITSQMDLYEAINIMMIEYANLTGYTIECYENNESGTFLGKVGPNTWDPSFVTYYKIIMSCEDDTQVINLYNGLPTSNPLDNPPIAALNLGYYDPPVIPNTYTPGVCGTEWFYNYLCMTETEILNLINKLNKLLDKNCNCC